MRREARRKQTIRTIINLSFWVLILIYLLIIGVLRMLYTMFKLTESGRIEYFKCNPDQKRKITSLEKSKDNRYQWIINRDPDDQGNSND